ncbi:MAG: hypothetical protein WC222_03455 [Parachlamydiales bacterium]|jgi:hypothetical protein
MPTPSESLSSIKTAFIEINSCVRAKTSLGPKNKTLEFAQEVMKESEYFTLINKEKDLIIASWVCITDDIQVDPFVFNILFPSSLQDSKQIEAELEKALSSPTINTFTIFTLLKSLNENAIQTFDIFLKVLERLEHSIPATNPTKAKVICNILIYLFEQFKNPNTFIECFIRAFPFLSHILGSISESMLDSFPWKHISFETLYVFPAINFFQHFLSISPDNPFLQKTFRTFCLRGSISCPSNLFSIVRVVSDVNEKVEILAWLCKNIPADIKEEVYSRRNESGFSVLYDICREGEILAPDSPVVWRSELGVRWHEILKDILIHTKAGFAQHAKMLPASLCLELLEIEDSLITQDLMEKLGHLKVIDLINLCLIQHKNALLKKILNVWKPTQACLSDLIKIYLTILDKDNSAEAHSAQLIGDLSSIVLDSFVEHFTQDRGSFILPEHFEASLSTISLQHPAAHIIKIISLYNSLSDEITSEAIEKAVNELLNTLQTDNYNINYWLNKMCSVSLYFPCNVLVKLVRNNNIGLISKKLSNPSLEVLFSVLPAVSQKKMLRRIHGAKEEKVNYREACISKEFVLHKEGNLHQLNLKELLDEAISCSLPKSEGSLAMRDKPRLQEILEELSIVPIYYLHAAARHPEYRHFIRNYNVLEKHSES